MREFKVPLAGDLIVMIVDQREQLVDRRGDVAQRPAEQGGGALQIVLQHRAQRRAVGVTATSRAERRRRRRRRRRRQR